MSQPPVFFDATLTPSRSLDARGFAILMGVVVAFNAFSAWRMASLGGWPILPFLGLDVAAIFLAFLVNYRSGRQVERIRLDQRALTVAHRGPGGEARDWSFEPSWVKVAFDERARPSGRVTITANGKGVAVAEFLSPRERREVVAALKDALALRARSLGAEA